jgi:hypothetical protein
VTTKGGTVLPRFKEAEPRFERVAVCVQCALKYGYMGLLYKATQVTVDREVPIPLF